MTFATAILAALLAFALETPSLPIRVGDAARKLSKRDVADIQRALTSAGKTERLFSINGGETKQKNSTVYGYLAHESATAGFRRCEKIMIARPSHQARWTVYPLGEKNGGTCAQVAVSGQSLDSMTSDRDVSRPFWVIGNLTDDEIISAVRFIRSRPRTSQWGGQVPGEWPIDQMFRALDGESVSVSLRAPNEYSGVSFSLQRDADTWIIKQFGNWVY